MMGSGVVLKLGSGKEVWPVVEVVDAEDGEIGFYFLVGLFCLAISLRMVCSGELDVVFEKSG